MKHSSFGADNHKDGLKNYLERISEVLDNGIEKLLESKVNKSFKIDDGAKEELRNIFIILFTGLCTPKIPSSISDCETRLIQWKKVDAKVKPNESERETLRNIAIKGKKNKVSVSFDKFFVQLKQWNQNIDMNVVLFLLLIVENILQAYLKVGIDYQNKMKTENKNILVLNTFKLIFAKYTNMDELHNLIIYDHIKKYTKSCKTWESQKNFHPFVKECRAQVEVILKLFKLPLQQANVDPELLNKLFGNIDDVYDSLGFIVEATEDCKDSTKMNLGNELMELVIMDVFQPFEIYAKSVLNLEHFEAIDKLLFSKDSMVPEILACHYGHVINIVFGKSTPRRRTELLSRYHLLHSCGSCLNPTDLPIHYTYSSHLSPPYQSQNSSTMTTSPSTETFLSFHTTPAISNQSNNSDLSSGNSSSGGGGGTSNNQSGSSSSGHSSRGSSPYPQAASSGYKTSSKDDLRSFPMKSLNSLSCNILVNSFRYLLPRLLLYPVFQFLYLYHILQNMSQPSDDASGGADTKSLTHVVRSMLQYARTFNILLYQHDRLIQLEFERSRCWFRVSEGSRDNIKDGNQKLEEIDAMMLRKLSDITAANAPSSSSAVTGSGGGCGASSGYLLGGSGSLSSGSGGSSGSSSSTYSSGIGSVVSSSDEYSISREYKGKTEFVMEGAVKFQSLGTGSSSSRKTSGKSSGNTQSSSPVYEPSCSLYSTGPCYPPPPACLFTNSNQHSANSNSSSSTSSNTNNSSGINSSSSSSSNDYCDRYLYLFSNFLLICKKTVKKSGFISGGQHSTKLRFKGKIMLDGQFSIRDDDVFKEGGDPYQSDYYTTITTTTISPSSSPASTLYSTHLQAPKIHSFILEFPAESSTGFHDFVSSSSTSHSHHHHGSLHSRSSPVSCQHNNSCSGTTASVSIGSSSPNSVMSHFSRASKGTSAFGSTNTLTSAKTLTSDGKDSIHTVLSSDQQSLFSCSSSCTNNFSPHSHGNHSQQQQQQQQQQVVLAVRIILPSAEDKADWIASLLMLQTHKLFYQFVVLKYFEEVPLKLPDSSVYRFAQPDSQFNIEYEPSVSDNSSDIPIIRAATLDKLVTHLTSHSFCDTKTLNKFLLIYRQFTTPQELLTTLIDRFEIPDPEFPEQEKPSYHFHTSLQERMLKRFRTSYKRKVQLRVINFLALWTSSKNRFFRKDFANNHVLLEELDEFLNRQTKNSSHLAQKISSIHKQIQVQSQASALLHTASNTTCTVSSASVVDMSTEDVLSTVVGVPDPIQDSTFNFLNVHPVELAQQITLLEWRLYSKIEFWEVHSREISSEPNYLTSVEFSNKIMHWLVYEIVSRANILDRATVILRVIDLMLTFEEQSNLQGSQECRGALVSSAVYRLRNTFELITNQSVVNSSMSSSSTPCYQFPSKSSRNKYKAEIEALRRQEEDNTSESYTTTYKKKVYTVVAPAIPYIAMGDKTHLIHLDQSNPDFIVKVMTDPRNPESPNKTVKLINFCKFRLMADLIEHYLSFQSIGYSFKEEPFIQSFLRKLDPYKMAGVDEKYKFDEVMYKLSLQIQPRNNDPAQSSVVMEKRSMTDDQIRISTKLLEQNLNCPIDTSSTSFINLSSTNTTNNSPVTMPGPPPRPPRKASNPLDPPARPPRQPVTLSNNCLATTEDSPPPPPLPNKPTATTSTSLHFHNSHQRHHSLSPPVLSPPPLPRKLGGTSSVSSTPPPLPPPPLQHQ